MGAQADELIASQYTYLARRELQSRKLITDKVIYRAVMIIVKVRLFSWKHTASHLIGAMLVPRLVMSRSLEPFGHAFRFSYFSALILMSTENGLGPIRFERATMRDLEKARVQMVEQLVHRGIHDAHVLDAMGTVAREKFIDEGFIEFAYEDTPHNHI